MSTEVADEIAADPETDAEEPVPSRRFDFASKKVKIAALLLAVMAVETNFSTLGNYLFFRSLPILRGDFFSFSSP